MSRCSTTQRLPWKYVPVGETIEIAGATYRCIERAEVEVPLACSGCAFMRPDLANRNHCAGLKCSRWDRADNRNVWFEEVSGD